MSEVKHYTIVTTRGLEKIQAKYQASQTVNLTHMGFGGTNEYIAPDAAATVVPNQWAKVPLERHPDEGFIGGGATVSNKEEYKGYWLGSVGIYDEDDELILIAATPLVEISLDESVVASYPIDIYTVLDNASSVVVVTDTSMTYATHDELNTAIESVENKIPLAASAKEVAEGVGGEVWVSPETLKPQLDEIKNALRYPATTEKKGIVELATLSEVNEGKDSERVITPASLDKPGLLKSIKEQADTALSKKDVISEISNDQWNGFNDKRVAFTQAPTDKRMQALPTDANKKLILITVELYAASGGNTDHSTEFVFQFKDKELVNIGSYLTETVKDSAPLPNRLVTLPVPDGAAWLECEKRYHNAFGPQYFMRIAALMKS